MTRKEVKDRLREALENYGPVGQLGKFEGEGEETMYFYSLMMDGDGEYRGVEGDSYTVFDVDAAEIAVLDLPKDTVAFVIHESDQGFVYGTPYNQHEYERFEREVSKIEEQESEEY